MDYKIDMHGQKYNMLTVLQYVGQNKHKQGMWRCVCDCGKEKIAAGVNIRKGVTQSCGCLMQVTARKNLVLAHDANLDHGHKIGNKPSKEYSAWRSIINRCTNSKQVGYKQYGGKGITVCDRWLKSFDDFLADVGPAPSKKHSIDRIDGTKGYYPENCRWASYKEQQRNRSSNVKITYNGKTQILIEWAEEYGIRYNILQNRIQKGWDIEKALTTPPMVNQFKFKDNQEKPVLDSSKIN